MSIALSEFWTRLVRSGITDAAGCKRLAMAFAKANRGTPPEDSTSLAKFMLAIGKLTKYQARALISDQSIDLRVGGYLIRSKLLPRPMNRWVEASQVSGGRLGHLLRTEPGEWSESCRQWMAAHGEVTSPSLQAFELESTPTSVCVFSPLPKGGLLHKKLAAGGKLSARETCQIGLEMSGAIEAMHARQLTHGAVRPDRVWLCETGDVVLLRDPSGPPIAPNAAATKDAPTRWLSDLEHPRDYAAPEFANPKQDCDMLTDLYSLGCLLYRLVSGKPVVKSDSFDAAIALHGSQTPSELAGAVALGDKGDPLYRVIAFAMAKSREARFTSAEQLAGALRATLPLLENESPVASPQKPVMSRVATKPAQPSAIADAMTSVPDPVQPIAPIETKDAGSPQAVTTTLPSRRRKKKKGVSRLFLGALCFAVLMLMIGLLVYDPDAVEDVAIADQHRPPVPKVIPPVSSGNAGDADIRNTVSATKPEAPDGYELSESDRLLYVPPYADDENDPPLELLPPGPAMILSVDLAAITKNANASSLAQSMAPELSPLFEMVAKRSGVPIRSIRRCSAAMHAGKSGWPEVSLAIELNEPQTLSELTKIWKVDASRTPDGATIYADDAPGGDAYYVPDAGETVSRFAVGSVARISEVAADEGLAILLPRSLQQLWNGSSDQADFVIMTTPNFLFADGREMLLSFAPELVAPLKSVLIPEVSAALVTVDVLDGQVFLETRLTPSGGISEVALMRSLGNTVNQWPTWAEEFIVDSVPDPSWRLLASRMPSMMRFVSDRTRVGVSNGSVVANTYLPAGAVSQITLATLLAMNTGPSGDAMTPADGQPTKTLTVMETLDVKMSVAFDQESLEFAIDAILGGLKNSLPAGSMAPPVRIIGGDLQKMGITQNQQVRDFSKTEVPLRAVLTELVIQANPDKSAKGAKDLKQALIWVVADDPQNPGQQAILVTTRQAAKNKYQLPSEFLPQ